MNLGLESLHLRMARHSENGLAMARFLSEHPKVAWVRHPSLEGDAQYALAQKYLPKGSCGVVSFGVAGGRAAAETFMANLEAARRSPRTWRTRAPACCIPRTRRTAR